MYVKRASHWRQKGVTGNFPHCVIFPWGNPALVLVRVSKTISNAEKKVSKHLRKIYPTGYVVMEKSKWK